MLLRILMARVILLANIFVCGLANGMHGVFGHHSLAEWAFLGEAMIQVFLPKLSFLF